MEIIPVYQNHHMRISPSFAAESQSISERWLYLELDTVVFCDEFCYYDHISTTTRLGTTSMHKRDCIHSRRTRGTGDSDTYCVARA